jgi:hypothetical protein
MSGDLDLSDLPDDPTELMFAILEETLDRVARKMAYSGNQTYIPVLLEFLRFQVQQEATIDMTSYFSRLNDNVPPEELMIFSPEQSEWNWWIEWLGNNPQVQPSDGYVGWKGQLYTILDPGLGGFLYDGIKQICCRRQSVILTNESGGEWRPVGNALASLDGSDRTLPQVASRGAYRFGWYVFYPHMDIYSP